MKADIPTLHKPDILILRRQAIDTHQYPPVRTGSLTCYDAQPKMLD
jgi:hypothetical protein